MKKIYQVNLTEKVDGSQEYWVSKWDADGYVGITTDTVYSDGVDQTNWCLFTGTKEECEHWVALQPDLKMYEFHTTNGNFEDGHADGYIWNVVYRDGKPTFLSEEEIKAFLESYYEMEVTLQEDNTWANYTWLPTVDPWWEGRVSLQEFVWDEEADAEYPSGRQPKL